jgi:hypothetical protein
MAAETNALGLDPSHDIEQAANLAKKADELMEEMQAALMMYVRAGHGMSTDPAKQGNARQAALYALDKYKEQNQ